ncbi:MAG: putative peptidoglycan glycosyltransferase FtsW [Candidatus Paceibacterota bacterium]
MNKHSSKSAYTFIVVALSIVGILIFSSAALGVIAKSEAKFITVAINQIVLGFAMGMIAFFTISYIPYKFWRKISLFIFIFACILATLVFVPGIGIKANGAARWIGVGNYSFQPSEFLKISYVIFLAAIFSRSKEKIKSFKKGVLPYLGVTAIVAALLMLEPDNDTFFITASAGFAMFIVAGAKFKHILLLSLVAVLALGGVLLVRPYARERVMTFFHPSANSLTSGYQIQQSLIAIGNGGIFGKGFGQSAQKFGFLPEPMGDSIFAVASEEFGFLGSVTIILLFVAFALSALKIAAGTDDSFGRLLVVGIVILVVSGSFSNIASMLGIIPLSGTPLLFISQGGTALLTGLAEAGIILSVSRKKHSKLSRK